MAPARKTTDQQLHDMLDFMERHQDIARARLPQDPDGKAALVAKWGELARILNNNGCSRPPTYWRTYWHEFKYKTKLKAMKVKKSIVDCERVRLPQFTEFEVRLLNILGMDVPKRPRSPIPVKIRKRSHSGIGSGTKPPPVHAVDTKSIQWDINVQTKIEPDLSQDNLGDESEYDCSFLQGDLQPDNGRSDRSTYPQGSDDSNILAWAHQLEKRRIEGEHRLADAMFAIAKSQSEMAQAQQSMAEALNGIRRDIQMYLGQSGPSHEATVLHDPVYQGPHQ